MNNKDLQVLEHAHVARHAIGQAFSSIEHSAQAQHDGEMERQRRQRAEQEQLDNMAAIGGIAVAVKVRNQSNMIAAISRENFERSAAISASMTAVTALTKALAAERKVPVEEVKKRIDEIMTAQYDKRIDEFLHEGELEDDPRMDADFKEKREWHQP